MDIKGEAYFHWPFKLVAVLVIVAAVPVFGNSPIASVVMAGISIVVLTAYYGVSIDKNKRTCKEYVWLLGWKSGDVEQFEEVQYLFVKPVTVTRTYNTRVQSSTVRTEEYIGFLKLSNDEKIELVRSSRKTKVVEVLRKVKAYLGTRIIDYSDEHPVEI